jgi:hypothetical protein
MSYQPRQYYYYYPLNSTAVLAGARCWVIDVIIMIVLGHGRCRG